jgi:plastocyanin
MRRDTLGARKEQHMHRKLIAGVAGLTLVAGGAGVASAAKTAAASKNVTVSEKQSVKFKVNRYVQDGLRWNKDSYTVKTGGKVTFLMNVVGDGPHTFTVVKAKDLPKTSAQIGNCKICNTLGKAHGANPNSQAPPKFAYLENGVGSKKVPNLDKPGDSGFLPPKKGAKITFPVTAKAGTTLSFICLVHPWMQAKVKVVK